MGLWERLHRDDVPTEQPSVGEAVDAAQAPTGPAARQEVWGRPGRCPECSGRGYLDGVDLINRIQYEKCTECGHKWSVTEAETVKL